MDLQPGEELQRARSTIEKQSTCSVGTRVGAAVVVIANVRVGAPVVAASTVVVTLGAFVGTLVGTLEGGACSHPKNISVDRHMAVASHSVLLCTLKQLRGSQLENPVL